MYNLAHLGFVDYQTTKLDLLHATLVEKFGLIESGRDRDSVYLKDIDDYEDYSLKLSKSTLDRIERIGIHASSINAVNQLRKNIEMSEFRNNIVQKYFESDSRFQLLDPNDHILEIFFNEQNTLYRREKNKYLRYLGLVQLLAEDVLEYERFLNICLNLQKTNSHVGCIEANSLWYSINGEIADFCCTKVGYVHEFESISFDIYNGIVHAHKFTISNSEVKYWGF